MTRLHQAIEREPERFSDHADWAMAHALGADVSGLPWTGEMYAQKHIRFGKNVDIERAYLIMCQLHLIHRRGVKHYALMGAKLRQGMKALETANNCGGNWELAWLYTGLPEPRPNNKVSRGIAHPGEFAANVAYLKEVRSLEDSLKLRGGAPVREDGDPDGARDLDTRRRSTFKEREAARRAKAAADAAARGDGSGSGGGAASGGAGGKPR